MDEIQRIAQLYKEYLAILENDGVLAFQKGSGVHLDDKYFKEVFNEYEVEDQGGVGWHYKLITEFGGQTFFALSNKR